MNKRELLERAAMAAGWSGLGEWDEKWGCLTDHEGWTFDSIDCGDDALRLAVKLGISVEPYPLYEPIKHSVICKQRRGTDKLRQANPTEVVELYRDSDSEAATRLAITRCAASCI